MIAHLQLHTRFLIPRMTLQPATTQPTPSISATATAADPAIPPTAKVGRSGPGGTALRRVALVGVVLSSNE